MKRTLLVSILLISLMVIATPIGFSANPPIPPTGYKFVGPAIEGDIHITPSLSTLGWVTATFVGKCGKTKFSIGPVDFGGSFDTTTPDVLMGQTLGRLGEQIPMDCATHKAGYDTEVRIIHVKEFREVVTSIGGNRTGSVITADIVAKYVVIQ
jgi:hypothetical protein